MIPEPDFGPLPGPDPDIRPPEKFVPEEHFGEPPVPQSAEQEEVIELTDEERASFATLMTVGKRSKTIDVMGHAVTIQSLRVSDDLRIGVYCRPYEGTKMEQRAFQVGVCAAGIRAINGQPLHQSLGPITDGEMFDAKVEKVVEYYPIVITKVYRAIMNLDQEYAELAVKLGKIKG